MAEPGKQQIGDGQDNYGHAAKQARNAAKNIGKNAGKEAGKQAAKQAAAKGAEATVNSAAATVKAGVETGKAVSEIAAGTAAGGPWGAIISAAWAMRHKQFYGNYDQWLEANGIKKLDIPAYFLEVLKTENPTMDHESQEFFDLHESAMKERYFEYYDYLYSEMDAYLNDYYFFEPGNMSLWLYVKKGVEEAKYDYMSVDYYKALAFKKSNGRYPTEEELQEKYDSLPLPGENLKDTIMMYEEEFYMDYNNSSFYVNTYMVNEEDYIAFSKQLGETHPTATETYGDIDYGKSEGVEVYAVDGKAQADVEVDMVYYGTVYYTVIHSNDPDKTAAWLNSEFSDLKAQTDFYKPLLTPDSIFDRIIENKTEEILTSLITMAVLVVLMSVCMYFIMRSSLMNRIKEVGIYRAIGVSKKNLVFKFFIEAIVLTTLTVFVGFLLTSAFLYLALGMSSLVAELFYYPLWLALADLILLYVISLFFGTLPILSLLRKTPSEILAKYDI